jgi:site-specific recombinase XerD
MSIFQHIQDFLNDLRIKNYADLTTISYESDLRLLCTFLNCHTLEAFSSLKMQDLHQFVQSKPCKKTLKRHLCSLKKFTRFLNLKIHPFWDVTFPKVEKSLPRPLNQDQATTLVKKIDETSMIPWVGKRDYCIVMIMYGLGLRIQETLSICLGKGEKGTAFTFATTDQRRHRGISVHVSLPTSTRQISLILWDQGKTPQWLGGKENNTKLQVFEYAAQNLDASCSSSQLCDTPFGSRRRFKNNSRITGAPKFIIYTSIYKSQ